jgi:ZIP family zinc transporter
MLNSALWGWFAGSSLLLGAAAGYYFNFPLRFASAIMAFGSGVLMSALSFELMDEAYKKGGSLWSSVGFVVGALLYTFAASYLNKRGAKHRKRSQDIQPTESEMAGSGLAIALGAFLDGIPESIVIGLSLLAGKGPSIATIVAIFISNIPEGLSSASGMKLAERSPKYIFGLWFGIMFTSGLASLAGFAVFSHLGPELNAGTIAFAAGAILAMISTTMIPEAYQDDKELSGLITVFGFLVSFITSKIS